MSVPTSSFVSVQEAADLIGITDGRVRQLLRSGELRGHKVNERAWIIPMDEVERFRKLPPGKGRARISEKSPD